MQTICLVTHFCLIPSCICSNKTHHPGLPLPGILLILNKQLPLLKEECSNFMSFPACLCLFLGGGEESRNVCACVLLGLASRGTETRRQSRHHGQRWCWGMVLESHCWASAPLVFWPVSATLPLTHLLSGKKSPDAQYVLLYVFNFISTWRWHGCSVWKIK